MDRGPLFRDFGLEDTDPPHPSRENQLERKPNVERLHGADVRVELRVHRHLQVRREDRDQQRNKADAGVSASAGHQHADPAENLTDAADLNEQRWCRKPRRDDPHVKARMHEVIDARRYKKECEYDQRNAPHQIIRQERSHIGDDTCAMPFALASFALFLSMWIVIPGPIVPLFILTVGGTELWPVLTVFNAIVLLVAFRSHGSMRPAAIILALLALSCTLVPPIAYAIRGPHVPLSALLMPLAKRAEAIAVRPSVPLVLTIYGGAWEHGSPKNDGHFNAIVASWGYRVIALHYPHAPYSRWPTQRDVILRQIDSLPAGRIALLGHSSGAQLAIIAAAMRPHRISAVITYESPVDLRLAYEYPPRPDLIDVRHVTLDLCGGTPEQQPLCYRSASPRYVVHAGMPPVLMIAAGRDHVVDLRLEHVLRDELRGYGVGVTYVELPWADHAFEDVAVGFHNRIALWYVRRFLDLYLGSP